MRTIASCCLLLGMVSAGEWHCLRAGCTQQAHSEGVRQRLEAALRWQDSGWVAALQYFEAARDR